MNAIIDFCIIIITTSICLIVFTDKLLFIGSIDAFFLTKKSYFVLSIHVRIGIFIFRWLFYQCIEHEYILKNSCHYLIQRRNRKRNCPEISTKNNRLIYHFSADYKSGEIKSIDPYYGD